MTSPRAPALRLGARSRAAAPGVAELAWALQRLCELGVRAREAGVCLGELRRAEVEFAGGSLVRRRAGGALRALEAGLRTRRHLRRGHDHGCLGLGVPVGTLRAFAAAWDAFDARDLLLDDIEAIAVELASGARWSPDAALAALRYAISRRIVPRPWDGTRTGAAPLARRRPP